jgi:GNAT superfamily N-acetyltransferase
VTPLTLRPLTPDDFPVVERLFGPNGAASGCWCMFFHLPTGKEWQATRGEAARQAFAAKVAGGAVHATLAFRGNDPVGFCRIGPRQDFVRLARSRALRQPADPETWSVVCFFIHRTARRQGVAHALLAAATAQAFAAGAPAIEAYPVVPPKTGKLGAGFAYTGVPALYEAAGFRKVPNPAGVRPIYRLAP